MDLIHRVPFEDRTLEILDCVRLVVLRDLANPIGGWVGKLRQPAVIVPVGPESAAYGSPVSGNDVASNAGCVAAAIEHAAVMRPQDVPHSGIRKLNS